MKSVVQILSILSFSLFLSACGDSGGGGGTAAPAPGATPAGTPAAITQAMAKEDLANLGRTEESLRAVSLVFKTSRVSRRQAPRVSWDSRFQWNTPYVNDADTIAALNNYIQVATAYLEKYTVAQIQNDDGSVQSRPLRKDIKEVTEKKIELAKRTVERLQPSLPDRGSGRRRR